MKAAAEARGARRAATAKPPARTPATQGAAVESLDVEDDDERDWAARAAHGLPRPVDDALREPGAALAPALREDFQARMGRDFSQVRVHTSARAGVAAHSLDAAAFTVGRDVFFGPGRFGPHDAEGRRLIAHELAHVAQNEQAPAAADLAIGAHDAAEERSADQAADAALRGAPPPALAPAAPALRRAPGTGPGWSSGGALNAKERSVGTVRRVPIDKLDVGQQSDPKKPSGRAIVLIPAGFDPTKPTDILLHFHGHNPGWTQSGSNVADEQTDKIEAQIEASGRTQLLGLLPQGDINSSFGTTGGDKSFDSDAFIGAVLDTLVGIGSIKSRPGVKSVAISGHSGAGELINEKLLGGAANSSLPSKQGTLKEIVLIDAVNGQHEFIALQGFLKQRLADDLKALQALPTPKEQLDYLKTSLHFRSHFSHSKNTGEYYRQWHEGPLPKGKTFTDPRPLKQLLDDFFKPLTLDPSVVSAFRDNYQLIDAGTTEHPEMVGHDQPLQKALAVLPRHDPLAGALPEVAPDEVHEVLGRPGRTLPEGARAWAEQRFGRGFDGVRIHDDTQAARSARALHAQAYTVGRDIVFGPGRFAPGTQEGRRLLAHELRHVVQQQGEQAAPPAHSGPLRVAQPADALEQEAEREAERPDEPMASSDTLAEARPDLASPVAAAPTAGVQLQRAPAPKTVDAAMCEANANPNPAQLGECSYKEPEHCPTYEGWISTFTLLKTFDAKDTPGTVSEGFQVIGSEAADVDFNKASTPPKLPPPNTTPLKPGERFIDHPTDDWVSNCLPANLRATAYQLPADCADVAMILRHVWLAAHHRTETFNKWTLGSAAGHAEEKSTLDMITNEGTGGVAGMVAPYSDPATGKPLRSFEALAPLLHPGDILVWWHFDNGFDKPRTGGHTHTIAAVQHDPSGKVTGLTLLQGNEPLFQPQKDAIRQFLKKENPKASLPTDKAMGEAPGRRIERTDDVHSGIALTGPVDIDRVEGKQTVKVWKWGKETLLVAAGPPRAAGARPPTQPVKGASGTAPQRLTDWVPALARAPVERFMGTLEGMLHELRATVEAGRSVPEVDVRAVGTAAGSAIWARGKAAGDLGNTSHFQPLQDVLDVIWAFINSRELATSRKLDSAYDKITGELLKHLYWLRDAFELAARGAADVDFTRAASGKQPQVNVLLTGFDPFDPTGSLRRPDPGQWNPSGAAVMALDNQRLPVADSAGHKATAAVEGIVLPVSFDRFDDGIVEQAVGPHVKELDALLTVSMDGRRAPSDPVRLERYAVGVREIGGQMKGVPAAPGGGLGPAAIESTAPLQEVAAATERPASKGQAAIDKPEIGESFVFDFGSEKAARDARAALGGDQGGAAGTEMTSAPPTQLMVKDSATVQAIVASMQRVGSGAQVQFKAKQKDFKATLVEGPGGNFLSNEVSYRAQRLLKGSGSAKDPESFHVHTPSAGAIPEGADGKKARSQAMAQRGSLVDTLKRVIGAVARLILDRRSAKP